MEKHNSGSSKSPEDIVRSGLNRHPICLEALDALVAERDRLAAALTDIAEGHLVHRVREFARAALAASSGGEA